MKSRVLNAVFIVLIAATPVLAGGGSTAHFDDKSFASPLGAQTTNSNSTEQSARRTLSDSCGPSQSWWSKVWSKLVQRKQTQCQLLAMQIKVNELDELTAQNVKAIKEVDARVQAGIQLASTKANEADQRAAVASNLAQLAQQQATQSANRVTSIEQAMENIDDYQSTIQTEIHFRPRQTILSQQAKSALDEIASPLKGQQGYLIEVQGFSSEAGDTAIQKSQVIADSVTQYLVSEHGIPAYRIHQVSLGNPPVAIPDPGLSRVTPGGRVEVNLRRNGLEQAATSTQDQIPRFPWPPPMASARQTIPQTLLEARGVSLNFKEIDQKLTGALEENGYFERSYFEAPNGFVLVTRLEQIEADGKSKAPPARWSQEMPSDGLTISGYLRALFKAPVGYYRIIAFVVGDASFHEDKGAATSGEAISWLTRGASSLPESIGEHPYEPKMSCTALIYEFQRQEQNTETRFLSPSHLDAYTHLVKSGLWKALGGVSKP